MVPFASWRPDTYGLNSQFANEALGVVPGAKSYRPMPSFEAIGNAVSGGPVIAARMARLSDGTYSVFAGTAARLYKWAGAGSAWTNVTRAVGGDYSVTSGERWSMDQFGDQLVAVAEGEAPQVIDVDSGTNFAALGGSPPQARFVKVVGDFLFLGDLSTGRNRIAWSGRNAIDHWTFGDRDSDFQALPDGGFVTGLTGIEAGMIFQQGAVRSLTPVPSRAAFAIHRIQESQGLVAPHSLVMHERVAYYLGEDGFASNSVAGGFAQIGAERVDKWFQDLVNPDNLYSMVGALDPIRPRVFWLFATAGNATNYLDHILCYDILLNEFSHAPVTLSLLFSAAVPGITLEGLDALYASIDAMDISLDSRVWQGGQPLLAGFDSADKLTFASGANMAATVQTALFQPIPGKRVLVNGFRPVCDAEAVTGRVASTERPQSLPAWGASAAVNDIGLVPARTSGRMIRCEMAVAAGETWDHLGGADFADDDLVEDGMR